MATRVSTTSAGAEYAATATTISTSTVSVGGEYRNDTLYGVSALAAMSEYTVPVLVSTSSIRIMIEYTGGTVYIAPGGVFVQFMS